MGVPNFPENSATDLAKLKRRVDQLQITVRTQGSGSGGGGGEGPGFDPRGTASATTGSLAPGDSTTATPINMAKGYRVLKLTTSRPARVRLYATAEARDADLGRPIGIDPPDSSGLMLDYATTNSAPRLLSPLADGVSLATPPSTAIPMTVTNLDGVAGTVQVVLLYARTE